MVSTLDTKNGKNARAKSSPRRQRGFAKELRAPCLLAIVAFLISWRTFGDILPAELASSLGAVSISRTPEDTVNLTTTMEKGDLGENISIANVSIFRKPLDSFLVNNSKYQELRANAHQDDTKPNISAPPSSFTIIRKPFDSFFVNASKYQELKMDADQDGMIFDFAVIGYPKCGTTTMIANLGSIAPIPAADICTPLPNTVWYAYHNWPKDHGEEKVMRGVKCPRIIDDYAFAGGLSPQAFSKHMPRTKLIVGIRHPVLWFQSFYNMQASTFRLPPPDDALYTEGGGAVGKCKPKALFCLNRARFHLGLALLGKTPLNEAELELLPEEISWRQQQPIRNPVFLYETDQLGDTNEGRKEKFWSDLGKFIGYPTTIPHEKYAGAHGKKGTPRTAKIDICEARYDWLRGNLLVHGYYMSKWVCDYFVMLGKDVHVSSQDYLCELVENYALDPCKRLIRLNETAYHVVDGNTTNTTIHV